RLVDHLVGESVRATPRPAVQLDHDRKRPGALRPVETRQVRRAGVTDVLDVLDLDVVAHADLLFRVVRHRDAPRLRRGAASVGGMGAISGPPSKNDRAMSRPAPTDVEGATALPGRPERWGYGGHV